MSNVIKQGLRQQQKSLSERLAAMEQTLAKVLFGVNQRFGGIDQRLGLLEEQTEALVNLQGAEDVTAYVNDRRIERARAQAQAEKASLEEGIKDGYVTTAETCGEKSLIVGHYTDKDGKVEEPGRAQLVMPGVQDQFRAQLMGKGVGTKLKLPNGGDFVLEEIYSVDEEKAKTVAEEKQRKAAEAAAAAASQQAAKDEAADTQVAPEAPPAETAAPPAPEAQPQDQAPQA